MNAARVSSEVIYRISPSSHDPTDVHLHGHQLGIRHLQKAIEHRLPVQDATLLVVVVDRQLQPGGFALLASHVELVRDLL